MLASSGGGLIIYQAYGNLYAMTAEADPKISAPNDVVPYQQGPDEGSKNYTHDHTFAGTNQSVLVDKIKSAGDGSQMTTLYQVAELKKHKWKLPKELLDLPGHLFSVQSHIYTLEALPDLLNKVVDTLNRFASILNAHNKGVPLACKSTASPVKGEKNTNLVTKDVELENLADHISIYLVEEYHKKKLLYNKYCDKMLKRKKTPKVTNCEVLTKKGPITLKIYREDGSEEVISSRKTRLDQQTQTKQELKIDLSKPIKEQDHMNELNELANKKRKRASDFSDEPRSAKKVKSSVQQ
nr:hypothetical protein [Tanacetum cinerariifolium]